MKERETKNGLLLSLKIDGRTILGLDGWGISFKRGRLAVVARFSNIDLAILKEPGGIPDSFLVQTKVKVKMFTLRLRQ